MNESLRFFSPSSRTGVRGKSDGVAVTETGCSGTDGLLIGLKQLNTSEMTVSTRIPVRQYFVFSFYIRPVFKTYYKMNPPAWSI
jgi:hypothetical protein